MVEIEISFEDLGDENGNSLEDEILLKTVFVVPEEVSKIEVDEEIGKIKNILKEQGYYQDIFDLKAASEVLEEKFNLEFELMSEIQLRWLEQNKHKINEE